MQPRIVRKVLASVHFLSRTWLDWLASNGDTESREFVQSRGGFSAVHTQFCKVRESAIEKGNNEHNIQSRVQ